jgi:hypothetical protein
MEVAPDIDTAIAFLEAWDDTWLLSGIKPDTRVIETRFFDDTEVMRAWLERHVAAYNIYFSVNRTKPGLRAKASKADITEMLAPHVDLDPPKDPSIDLAAAQAAILDRLKAHNPPPSCIIFSGGGYQGFWRLDEPVAVADNIAELEACNIALEAALGGDHCFNLDRIMRVPGTINWPDAKKRAAGRIPTPTELVYFDPDRVYRLDDFPHDPAGGDTQDTEPDDFADKPPISTWLRDLIYLGHPRDNPGQWGGDRSKAVWAAVCGLVKSMWTDEQIIAALLDPNNAVGEHIREKRKPKPAEYAQQTVLRAREAVARDTKKEPSKTRQFSLIRVDEIAFDPGVRFLVEDLVPRDGLVVIWGPPACGKSFFTFDLMGHIALGLPYRNRQVEQGPVVYIAAENENGIRDRAIAFRNANIGATACPLYLMVTSLDLVTDGPELKEAIRQHLASEGHTSCAAIAIDTLNRTLHGSENKDEDMSAYLAAGFELRAPFPGCTVFLVHHCGVGGERPRGHSSLTGAADAQLAAVTHGGEHHVAIEKQRDGAAGETLRFKLKPVDVGLNARGKMVTSCIVEHLDDASPASGERRKRKLSGAQARALTLLQDAVARDGEIPPASNHIPPNVRCVREELWRQYCYQGGLSAGEDRAKRKAFERAADTLLGDGRIGSWDRWYWPV